jgi:hypothetical protein
MTLDHRKIAIIQEIASSTHEDFINAIDEVIQKFARPKFKLDLSKHSNIREAVDIEKIKIERPLVKFDMSEFEEEANNLQWGKSIKELLTELD